MRKFRTTSHAADIRLVLTADSLSDLYRAALEGMADILKQGFCQTIAHQSKQHAMQISAGDRTALLIDFLADVLTASYNQRTLFCGATFPELSDTQLSATLSGAVVPVFERDIKGVMYHEADIQEKNGKYMCTIVFDI